MSRRTELLIALPVIAFVIWAVVSQLGTGPEAPAPASRVLEVGEAVPPDITLLDLDGRLVRLGDRFGRDATVLYAWSTRCLCVPVCDRDLGPLIEQHGDGVAWIAIGGEPSDDVSEVRRELEKLDTGYSFLRDPTHRLCGPLGFDRASLIVVLDADGYVRYRGSPTDALRDPTRILVAEVLPAVVAGRRSPLGDLEPAYGCPFSEPLADCPDEELAELLGSTP